MCGRLFLAVDDGTSNSYWKCICPWSHLADLCRALHNAQSLPPEDSIWVSADSTCFAGIWTISFVQGSDWCVHCSNTSQCRLIGLIDCTSFDIGWCFSLDSWLLGYCILWRSFGLGANCNRSNVYRSKTSVSDIWAFWWFLSSFD